MDYTCIKPNKRGLLNQVHIADLHFGAFDPKKQYDILKEQFLDIIIQIPKIDIIAVDGDIFDHKVMSNSDSALYASLFINNLVDIARKKNSTLILLHGTYSHDYDQLKLFYHYLDDNTVDVRIVTTIKFEYVKGAKILCIPELYGVDESIYQHYFNESGWYDAAFIHGTFKGAVYGDNVGNGRLLTPEDFKYCTGVAISGHVHKSGCFNGFFYYCGCPYRWKFGEEEEKGFLLLTQDLDSRYHYVQFEPIKSFRYDTIYLDELISEDPKKIIDYINKRKEENGIDNIKVKFRVPIPGYNKTIINNYYRNNPHSFVEFMEDKEIRDQQLKSEIEQGEKYNYLVNSSMSDLDKFVQFVNDSEGSQFITVEKLSELLSDKI
jgi:DNA repair exonuclease SbcCD nuclease subunit